MRDLRGSVHTRVSRHGPRYVFALIALGFFLAPSFANACPACKESLFDPSQLSQRLSAAKGYAWSIGLMLTVPLLLLSWVTTLIVRAARRRHLIAGDSDGQPRA